MKRILALYLALGCLALLGCAPLKSDPQPSAAPSPTPPASAAAPSQAPAGAQANYRGKVVQVLDNALLLAGEGGAGDLCTLALKDVVLTAAYGEPLKVGLSGGMEVEVGYSGVILETYPAQLAGPVSLRVIETGEDWVGLYAQVLQDLFRADEGLNAGISRTVFDLSAAGNLSESEKSALVYRMGQALGYEAEAGSYETLQSEGSIDPDEPYFEDGMLFSLKLKEQADGRITFDAEKWRSALGAYVFYDCTALKQDGVWRYTVGSHMVS